MKRLNDLLMESAEEWGLSARLATWIFWMPIVGAILVAATRINRDVYRFLLQDDGPVEWAQFTCFVIACVAGTAIAYKRFKVGYQWQGVLYAGFALVMLFVAGEEIAWGQRLFGLDTPENLAAINKQGEITLHNIGEVLTPVNLVMMFGGALGSVAYLLNKKIRLERYWDQANYLLVPPFFLVSAFLVLFLYKFVRFTLLPESGFTVTKYSEWAEFCLAFALCIFTWLNYRRLAGMESAAAELVGANKL